MNTRGIIALSWKNLVKGYLDNSDGRNLGLHEMAHALKIVDAIKSDEYNFMDPDSYYAWLWSKKLWNCIKIQFHAQDFAEMCLRHQHVALVTAEGIAD